MGDRQVYNWKLAGQQPAQHTQQPTAGDLISDKAEGSYAHLKFARVSSDTRELWYVCAPITPLSLSLTLTGETL